MTEMTQLTIGNAITDSRNYKEGYEDGYQACRKDFEEATEKLKMVYHAILSDNKRLVNENFQLHTVVLNYQEKFRTIFGKPLAEGEADGV